MDNQHLILSVAGLNLVISTVGTGLSLKLPPTHQKFIKNKLGSEQNQQNPTMNLVTLNNPIPPEVYMAECLCKMEIFEIFRMESGGLALLAPRQDPPRVIVVDRGFTKGELIGNFSKLENKSIYPIQYTDIVFFSNWLANFGDLILHASGVALEGKGYCFVGRSGVGKSTIASELINYKDVTILGEDQVVLRYQNGKFWIFGTPWHEKPEKCSPMGVPLESLFFLVNQQEDKVIEISPNDGYLRLMQTAFIPYYRPDVVEKIMETLIQLLKVIMFKEISFSLGTDLLKLIL